MIGSGITGLLSAYFARKYNIKDIIIIEREK